MKNVKLLSMLAIASAMLAGCPGPATPPGDSGFDAGVMGDGGHDTGPATVDMGAGDMGPMVDMGTDANSMVDANTVPLDCTGYCTTITTNCTAANAQYADMTTCMTQCAAANWATGAESDATGVTLGCHIYHALAAGGSTANATLHCPHAGWLSAAGYCTPFRTDTAVEGTPTATEGAFVRVDRMGIPAVATALLSTAADKDTYNDHSPNDDAAFTDAPTLLGTLGALHTALDAALMSPGNLTPCSATRTVPAPVPGNAAPICAVQQLNGTAISGLAGSVASLILPDTLRLDTTMPAGFPNGRRPQDAVIDPILSALLLSLSPCTGVPTCETHATMGACAADATCMWTGATGCLPLACLALGSSAACGANAGCIWTGTVCAPRPCEAITPATTCAAASPGCGPSTCGAGACSIGTFSALHVNPAANDVAFSTSFPYFATPH